MSRSNLWGRRVHIAGSISKDPDVASKVEVAKARELVAGLVKALLKHGANFVIPVDAEPAREDGEALTFDWTVWESLDANRHLRPGDAPGKLAVAVQHYKTEEQIPDHRVELWERFKDSDAIAIENAAHWDMNAKRMDAQARFGDILITLGGTEGVLYLADLYHEAGKPVIPLDLPLTPELKGSRRLHAIGLNSDQTQRLFRTIDGDSHSWINRIRFAARDPVEKRVSAIIDLLEALEPPHAFAVRLLNDKVEHFAEVEDFFETVVKPVIEGEFGYKLIVVDGEQPFDHARVDQEIFEKLHRSRVVLADLTAMRPNCFLELGYAFGRPIPTMVMGMDGTDLPFDVTTYSAHLWKAGGSAKERKDAFREHWNAIRNRPPLVVVRSLIA